MLTAAHLTEAIRNAEPSVAPENVLSEPLKRNTSGCLCWLAANLLVSEKDPANVTLAILAADHKISPVEAYCETVEMAMAIAENEGALVTIGIRPDRPETGYGYVEANLRASLSTVGGSKAYLVKKFHEKPSLDLATQYAETDGFYWNSGMFFWRLDTFLAEMERVAPLHFDVIHRLVPLLASGNQLGAERVFAELPDISIDYLLMERASKVAVVEATFEWDDVGSWDALSRYAVTDARGNTEFGDTVLVHSADCVVHNAAGDITVCMSGVYGLLVVVTDDAVLVCDRTQAQSVKDIVGKLKERGSSKL